MPPHENAPVAMLRFPAAEAGEPAARIRELAATPEINASDREYSRSVENDSHERTSGYLNGASFTPAAAAGERRRAAPTSPADSTTITIPIAGAPEISNAVRTNSASEMGPSALEVSNRIRCVNPPSQRRP